VFPGLQIKYLLILPDYKATWTFWTEFQKMLRYQSSAQWEPSCSVRWNRQTWRSR